ncbi:MAG: transposase, partial [Planctomycetota bacterium]
MEEAAGRQVRAHVLAGRRPPLEGRHASRRLCAARLLARHRPNRRFCPSCGGRRMAETAMHLADEVLPAVPLRQWVLSFPYSVRFHLAYDAKLCAAVRRIFVRALLAWHAARAERAGVARGHSGAVVVAQRFGSALNLNLHFHALVLDGVYASADPCTRPAFHPAEAPSDGNVAERVALLQRRVLRYLARSSRLRRAAEEIEQPEPPPEPTEPLLALPGQLCASLDGFSLHAKVALEADDHDGRERLCRYL